MTYLHLSLNIYFILNITIVILKPMGRHGMEREWDVGEMFLNAHEEYASYSFKHSPGTVEVYLLTRDLGRYKELMIPKG